MELIETIKHIQAVIYSAFINYLSAVALYFILCRIPLEKSEVVIALSLWVVYFGIIYIFYCLFSLAFIGTKKIFLSVMAMLIAATVICSFHFIVTGFLFLNQRMIISFFILLLLSSDIPFLVYFINKKLK